jgi:DNA-binding CsgD family transcriptional regulator
MNVVSIGIYFLFLGMGLAAIYISYRLVRRYRFRFLDYYFYNIILSIAFGFINYVGKMFVHLGLAKSQSWDFHFAVDIIISSLALPAFIIGIYMMICWILEFLWGKISRRFKLAFWLIQALFILVNLTAIKIYLDTKEFKSIKLIFSTHEKIQLLIIIIAILYLVLKGKSLENKARRKLAINLGLFNLIGITAALGAYFFIFSYIKNLLVLFSLFAFSHITVEIIPLLYLKWFLGKRHAELGFSSTVHGIEGFFNQFKITGREQSIVRLMIKGKTNDEIGDELFISTKTVKNNISNIYQKTKVKNRIQLTNLVRGFEKEKVTSN